MGNEINRGLSPFLSYPDDQPFLVLAAAGAADFLVSKDRALLEMNRRGGLGFAIVTPTEACRRLGLIGVTD